MMHDATTWTNYAEALAFVGNSLLAPMNQTGTVGLDPEFWASFPDFGSEQVARALEACRAYAREARELEQSGGDAVRRASVEYTKLFVGPPRPAAAPWETMHRGEGATVGFGEPTFSMQRLLREAGLEVSNENNQYADHIGIELLYASVLCTRAAQAVAAGDGAGADGVVPASGSDAPAAAGDASEAELAVQLADFAREHPLGWIDRLAVAVGASEPDGYISRLVALAKALLVTLVQLP